MGTRRERRPIRVVEISSIVRAAIDSADNENFPIKEPNCSMPVAAVTGIQSIRRRVEYSSRCSCAWIANRYRRLSFAPYRYGCWRPNCDGRCARTNRLRYRGTVSVRSVSAASAEIGIAAVFGIDRVRTNSKHRHGEHQTGMDVIADVRNSAISDGNISIFEDDRTGGSRPGIAARIGDGRRECHCHAKRLGRRRRHEGDRARPLIDDLRDRCSIRRNTIGAAGIEISIPRVLSRKRVRTER